MSGEPPRPRSSEEASASVNASKCPDCPWCGREYSPRQGGGSPQRFCSRTHRQAYYSAARRYVDAMLRAGKLPVAELKASRTACTLVAEAHLTGGVPRPPLAVPCCSVGCSDDIGDPVASEGVALTIRIDYL